MALIENRKARFDYEILKTFHAGIELFGFEAKALLAGKGSLDGAYVAVRGGEAFLLNMTVQPYQTNNTPDDYEPARTRKLLLKKDEIIELSKADGQKTLTIVPISVYNKGSKVKLDIALVRGKKKFDKRETLKKRQTERDIARDLRG